MATGTNFKYAKIISETQIEYAPRVVKYGGKTICNPKESIYNAMGYYLITYTNYPDDEINLYNVHYELVGNQIIQTWVLVED